jgi:starch synthase
MKDKKVLFVSSEVFPYVARNEVSSHAFDSAKSVHSKGGKIRIFTPRYGVINERRNQLHEVIRLSGMNLVINDSDMPLIIKVASIPRQGMQVYFIDNEDYFKRKALFTDKNDQLFADNDERAIFFAKGVVETVKKLIWAPDVIQIDGWMSSLLPLYIKNYYKDEPLFSNCKIVTTLHNSSFEGPLSDNLIEKVKFDGIEESKITSLSNATHNNLLINAIENSDAVVNPYGIWDSEIMKTIENNNIPVLESLEEEIDAPSLVGAI